MPTHHPRLQLTDAWRMLRVGAYLVAQPQHARKYLQYGLSERHSPIELRMPWWSFGAVEAAAGFLRPDMEVFEFGSGGSSLFLAGRTKSVLCVEDNLEWSENVRRAAADLSLDNLVLKHLPFDPWDETAFHTSQYLLAIEESSYDVIVVDGTEYCSPLRPICFRKAEDHVRPGGCIVLDDAWRYPDLLRNNRSKSQREYKGLGYCRRGVTSTCVLRY